MSVKVLTLVILLMTFGSLSAAENIHVDGSSTVYPISDAVARSFGSGPDGAVVKVAFSGSSSGMRKLLAGEILISGASRSIKGSELEEAEAKGLGILEVPIAYDGITVVVSRDNTFIDRLSVEELRKIWRPDNPAKRWSDVRSGWPDDEIKLYGPGKDSGTFEYFTKAIVGKKFASRIDYVASEDDIELVQGVMLDPHALAYFGYSYFKENSDALKAVPVGDEGAAVSPTEATILDGSYQPLSRPLFVYTTTSAMRNSTVNAFIGTYLNEAQRLVPEAGYVALRPESYGLIRDRLRSQKTGSLFSDRKGAEPVLTILQRALNPALATPTPTQTPAPAPAVSAPAVTGPVSKAQIAAIDALRDATLILARKSLDDRSSVADIEQALESVQTHLSVVKHLKPSGALGH